MEYWPRLRGREDYGGVAVNVGGMVSPSLNIFRGVAAHCSCLVMFERAAAFNLGEETRAAAKYFGMTCPAGESCQRSGLLNFPSLLYPGPMVNNRYSAVKYSRAQYR
eukprot:GFKZ01010602.1.p1 GENE.GFKZ01010602.1~~GFKZ01010602.1.p1  ORF type:complete len:107 (-),score=3.95 GFKZ01010602.1:82-402(-)